ncbi:hypothetical protein KDK88_10520 [bacterium]|nr:hypothetical protein [bacterium]HPF36502.1 hypothetical protein [Candidatus Krumholzibacteria bacterium]HRX52185.1 hypothetical protein [Candidatus Krumholzibacteria bacterium]
MQHNLKRHLLVLAGLQILVFLLYHRILSMPFWSAEDLEVLHDALRLSPNPAVLLHHIGSVFSQPILQLLFVLEFRTFQLDPSGYFAVNLVLHGLNAFMLYLLVNMLFHRARMALPAAVLLAASVGNYGKALMSLTGQETLLLALLYLMVLYVLIRADFKHHGRISSPWYLLGLVLFGLAGLTRPALFSILLCLLAYKFFFYKERGGRGVFPPTMVILIVAGVLFAVFREMWGFRQPYIHFSEDQTVLSSVWLAVKTVFRYLNLMVFPMQVSDLLESTHPVVQQVYAWRMPIRVAVSLLIVSFSFFGFLFGSKPLRFFISWTYITVLPFSLTQLGSSWLNLQYLYLASLGFCVILAAGATGCAGLLEAHRWKRLVPWLGPLFFVVVTLSLNERLQTKYRAIGESPQLRAMTAMLQHRIDSLDD